MFTRAIDSSEGSGSDESLVAFVDRDGISQKDRSCSWTRQMVPS